MLDWLVEREIDPHVPVRHQSEVGADGKFVRADFHYDRERDLYICPGGKELKTSGTVHDGTTLKYIAKRSDCGRCPLKPNAPRAGSAEFSAMSIRMPATIPRS